MKAIIVFALLVMLGACASNRDAGLSCQGPKKDMGPFGPLVCTD